MKKYINKLELKKGIKKLKNKTSLFILTSSIIIVSLTGCNNTVNKVTTTTKNTTKSTTKEITTEDTTKSTTRPTTQSTAKNSKSKDEIITDFFDEQKKELKQYINSNDVEKFKSKGKELFTTFVDFIFYDKEIKGIKYDELSEGIKKQLYEDFCNIDELVSNYSPDYKENLSEKYTKVKDFVSPYYYSTKDKIKEYIGDNNLEKLENIKEDSKEVGKDLYNKSKEKIKEKYENWKDK